MKTHYTRVQNVPVYDMHAVYGFRGLLNTHKIRRQHWNQRFPEIYSLFFKPTKGNDNISRR